MDEAIDLPRLAAVATFCEHHLQPSVVAVPLGLGEFKQMLQAVHATWLVPIPKHSEHALFDGLVPRAIVLAQEVREYRIVSDRAELAKVTCQAEVQAAEHARLSTSRCVLKRIRVSGASFCSQERFQCSQQAQ